MNYKVEAWSWCADYCKKNQWNPHDSYFWNKANLEYRRQHNIFEVGDKVVSKNGCELVSEITYLQGGLAKIKNEKFDHVYSLQDFRHATDAEIEAGKRLEVK